VPIRWLASLHCPEAITPPHEPTSGCHRYVAIAGREKGEMSKASA